VLSRSSGATPARDRKRGSGVSFLERVEIGFSASARLVFRKRWAVLLLTLAATGTLITWVPELTVDNSSESFLLPSDPARKDYDALCEQFGQDEEMMIAVESPAVFDFAYLSQSRKLHEALKSDVPYLLEITSLLNARNPRGEGDQLIVEDLLEDWPETPEDLARLEARVREIPLFENTLINSAGTATTIVLTPFIYSCPFS